MAGSGWTVLVFAALFFTRNAVGQVYCVRAIGHTPHHERIFFQRGSYMAAERVVSDAGQTLAFQQTNRIDQLFADIARERTVGLYTSCLDELPLADLRICDPGDLLFDWDVKNLLNHTVAVPRPKWVQHASHTRGRYAFSLIDAAKQEYVIDLRAGSTAIIFFPDGTYRCLMDPNSQCVSEPIGNDLVTTEANRIPSRPRVESLPK